ncbi:ABC transporter ATP-binding protein [Aerococcus viridans]|uniref:ABC transporter ATP-binding protein n=1 Tax=Aerococcus viridans TaxID=1377 RepID=A0A2N6UAN3_9LACT|nr:ABC transporter ATP-binding protein [Aerococcus viridans]PMC78583.1 ABC transporter ATP-binding protein [Aerococcus viridans]
MKTLQVEHLSKIYGKKSQFKAVNDVSFEINSGEIVSLIGPNGAGKTTIVSMIGGYIEKTAGEIWINGKQKNYKNDIGVSFGGDLGFYGNVSAYDNLNFYADLANVPYKERKKEVHRVLDIVALEDVKNKKVKHFSKGMNQRLHIAKSLLNNPSLLLLDEPTNGLDIEIAKEIRDTIKKLTIEENISILLTSHIMGEIEALSDRILLIGSGSIKFEGTLTDVISYSGLPEGTSLEDAYLSIAPSLRRS